MSNTPTVFEQRFLDALTHHLDGWKAKVERDFSQGAFQRELTDLSGDPVYERFGFNCAEYVLVRLIGRMSISVGRRLGEIYDKVPRFIAAARFNLKPTQVAELFDGLEIDIVLRSTLLSKPDQKHIQQLVSQYSNEEYKGLGIEIRYNFNPNDSSRLRKDESVANKLRAQGLYPVYLIFSSISPRDEAIARLTRGGWFFIQGQEALDFMHDLLGVDIMSVLENPTISDEIKKQTQDIMRSIFASPAFKHVRVAG
ncbi:hypothetical protein ILT44_12440 [Microvirga sp. BT689]|uniref:hypothetical protein n=1 Tax=Microvirga arvi TaxID=2778731 RepID=UPI001951537F|nr:hypothetical protein [Microvirga arvi]MBM6580994.1 hypothetical protein [Microvirga arvi]